MYGEDLLLPEGGLLLHIGPHKTGTTAIQAALAEARPAMRSHRVVYLGRERQHQRAALVMTGGTGLLGDKEATQADWTRLVEQARRSSPKRAIVSSEFFDGADDVAAQRVVEGLGGDRVHVVVTLRPLAKILPSAWQQYVRNGLRTPYLTWLERILGEAPTRATPSFWMRHHHDVLIDRWSAVAGVDRTLVVVVDESDHDQLLRTFEQVTGLPPGLLVPAPRSNRSLTAGETELVRALNIRYRREGWPPVVYNEVVRMGMVEQMQRREPRDSEPRISTPDWAVERANEIAAAATERIAASGVRVVGDLGRLSQAEPEPSPARPGRAILSAAAAAEAVVGTLQATGALTEQTPKGRADRAAESIGTRDMARILWARVTVEARTWLRRGRR